jgi:hypothetical protein
VGEKKDEVLKVINYSDVRKTLATKQPETTQEQTTPAPVIVEKIEKKPGFFARLFGSSQKQSGTNISPAAISSTDKSPKMAPTQPIVRPKPTTPPKPPVAAAPPPAPSKSSEDNPPSKPLAPSPTPPPPNNTNLPKLSLKGSPSSPSLVKPILPLSIPRPSQPQPTLKPSVSEKNSAAPIQKISPPRTPDEEKPLPLLMNVSVTTPPVVSEIKKEVSDKKSSSPATSPLPSESVRVVNYSNPTPKEPLVDKKPAIVPQPGFWTKISRFLQKKPAPQKAPPPIHDIKSTSVQDPESLPRVQKLGK